MVLEQDQPRIDALLGQTDYFIIQMALKAWALAPTSEQIWRLPQSLTLRLPINSGLVWTGAHQLKVFGQNLPGLADHDGPHIARLSRLKSGSQTLASTSHKKGKLVMKEAATTCAWNARQH